MPNTIERDHDLFRKVISGKLRKALGKHIGTSSVWRMRGKGGRMRINLPSIDIPHFTYGEGDSGIGRGPGEKGKVVGKDNDGDGSQAGQEEAEGILVEVDMEDVLDMIQEELELPDMKPKPNQTYEDVIVKYNDIAKVGPESLRHNRRTMREALKRTAVSGDLDKTQLVPGHNVPIRIVTPINNDRRYRQWKEIKEPSSMAAILFGRDGSASMDQEKCDIISDMSWWIEAWISHFYDKVETAYFWHDVQAQEVDKDRFYKYRYGGGTACSSCLKLMSQQFENRFPPIKYNIYCFYFSDGENWDNDNELFVDCLEKDFNDNQVNLFALTQISCWSYNSSLKHFVDNHFESNVQKNISTASIGEEKVPDWNNFNGGYSPNIMTENQRNEDIKKAIITHLGRKKNNIGVNAGMGI